MLSRLRMIFAAAFIAVAAVSCTSPEKAGGIGVDSTARLVSIQYLKSFYNGYPYTFLENYKISGCVVSNDRYENIINTLIIKDDTGILEVKVDKSNLYESYGMGTYVELLCSNLSLGAVGGIIQLGAATESSGFEVGYIPENVFDRKINITGVADTEVLSERISITDLSDDYLSRLVSISDVMFEDADSCWCDKDTAAPVDAEKYLDTNRSLVDHTGNRLSVRTARYAKFAGWKMPYGSGTIEGIVSKYAGVYCLKVINPDILYVTMSSPRFDENTLVRP